MQSTRDLPSLFRRCVKCPDQIPTCPACPIDETCLLQSKSCDACPSAKCVRISSLPGQSEQKKASSTPAIAGGVAGGVVFIIIVTYLIWRFCIRKRRQEWDEQVWTETDQSITGVEKRDPSGLNRGARESTRSTGSIASTVRTRASNVIQIAYIPGVTNRSPTESPGLLAPPVPPIPLGSAAASTPTSPNFEQDRHFFMPNDLRDSTYSDLSGRQSLSPSLARASLATTIYRNNAEVSARPAQQALRGRAAVVNVNKSGNNTPPDSGSPEDAAAPPMSQTQKGMINSPIVARNVTAKPIQVKKSNSGKRAQFPTMANLQAASANKLVSLQPQPQKIEDKSEDETDASTHLMPTAKPHHQSTAGTIIEDTPAIKQSQFTNTSSSSSSTSDLSPSASSPPRTSIRRSSHGGSKSSTAASASGHLRKKSGSLNSLIEEAMTRAAREPSHGGLGSISESHSHTLNHPVSHWSESHGRSSSGSGSVSVSASASNSAGPFSDANELRESASRSS
jgi:protein OPY2